jgi:hypothetical protein
LKELKDDIRDSLLKEKTEFKQNIEKLTQERENLKQNIQSKVNVSAMQEINKLNEWLSLSETRD